MKKHYVYVHTRNDTDEIFYVGQGIDDRAWDKTGRNRWWRSIVKKHGFTPWIIKAGLSKQAADRLEIDLIAEYGRADIGQGLLVNLTDGGEGTVGRVLPDWEKKKRSTANLGQKRTDETKRALAAAKTGASNPNFNPKVYKWVHRDGRETRCTTNEMAKIIGVRADKTARVANSKEKTRSIFGWFIGKVQDDEIANNHKSRCPRGESHPHFEPTLRTFQHEDGREVTATTHEMRNIHGCDFGISSVVTGKAYSHLGWRLKGSEPYKPEVKWTREACIESAAPFQTKVDWGNSCSSAYKAARTNGWIDECCGHMICGHAARVKNIVNLDTGMTFPTARAAGDYYNVDPSTILKVCKRGKGTCGGYRWCYAEETKKKAAPASKAT